MKNYDNYIILEKFSITTGIKNTFKLLKRNVSKKTIKYLLISLLAYYSVSEINDMFNNPTVQNEISQQNLSMIKEIDLKQLSKTVETYDVETQQKINSVLNDTIYAPEITTKYVDPQTLKLSQKGWDKIREHEKLRLTAYSIGDGMITIGWGHAEPIKTSKYKIGDKITKAEAQRLYVKDINEKAEAARRMFRQWKEKGSDVKITQGQFDAIVSLMFNGGVTGFRRSDIATYLFNKDYVNASQSILSFNLNNKFSGLKERREKEKELFNS